MTHRSEARVVTTMPRRYFTQLCKHFEHRLTVRHGEGSGQIVFDAGICDLEAGRDELVLRTAAPDAAGRSRVEDVVARHLQRFAFREGPEIAWHQLPAEA